LTAAEYLLYAAHLGCPSDQRVDFAKGSPGIEIGAKLFERRLGPFVVLWGVVVAFGLFTGGTLVRGRAVGDKLHQFESGQSGLREKEEGMGFFLVHDGYQHVTCIDVFLPRGLHVRHRSLDDALKGGGLDGVPLDPFGELFGGALKKVVKCLAQFVHVNPEGFEDILGQLVEEQGGGDMFDRQEFVPSPLGLPKCGKDGKLKILAQHAYSSRSMVQSSGNSCSRASRVTRATRASAISRE